MPCARNPEQGALECSSSRARTFCGNLDYAGWNDWRLPTMHELAWLGEFNSQSYIDQLETGDTELSDPTFWSEDYGSTVAFFSGVIFRGQDMASQGDGEALARCVRGRAPYARASSLRYGVIAKDGEQTVFDRATGLEWVRNPIVPSQGTNWAEALAHCEGLDFAGHDDWRLPNHHEFHSIIDYSEDAAPFSTMPGVTADGPYWTSTVAAFYPNMIAYFDMSQANLENAFGLPYSREATLGTRCVRGPR